MNKTLKMKVNVQNSFNNIMDYEEKLIKAIQDLQKLCKENNVELPYDLSEEGLSLFSSTPVAFQTVANYINEIIDFAETTGDPVLTNILNGLGVAEEVSEEGSIHSVKITGNPVIKGEYLRLDSPSLEFGYNGQRYKAVIKESIEFKKDE